ncbi:sugar phosphate isomerase/epimerase [Flavobacteriaceae bacterium]|nr:sugar phosphate isomerase/epimerase [Flavobacteriaceae bacterium]MDB4153077.1 sugar phosphate isomerase/epimerase [Flavobacteriaceae bacterium]MDC1438911.1 sugar phosphate isomerase/epimerase [Flavobacteriaceae bacterium]
MKRRNFIMKSAVVGLGLTTVGAYACNNLQVARSPLSNGLITEPFFKLSLAQWSLNQAIRGGSMDPYAFAAKSHELGFEGLEYVSQLYTDVTKSDNQAAAHANFIKKSNEKAAMHGMKNLLIMIDGEGDLAVSSDIERKKGVINHHKWVETAAALGCHSIRINLFGVTDPEAWAENSKESLLALGTYAAAFNINIMVENHGYLSSDAGLLMQVLNEVNLPNCGTLPDFGNFCLERAGGARWDSACVKEYDRYQGVEELMPRAFAVSAKSHDFDAAGNETHTDYKRMIQIVKNAGFSGYIGVEYEGKVLSEEAGILATKNLLIKTAQELS